MNPGTGIRRPVTTVAAVALAASAALATASAAAPAPANATAKATAKSTAKAAAPDPNGAFLYRDGRFSPLAGVPGALGTAHLNVNDRGQTTGIYADAQGTLRSFVKDRAGRVRRFSVPGATGTLAGGVNNAGQVAGTYYDGAATPGNAPYPPGTVHGFVRRPDGRITRIDLPGFDGAAVTDINDRGQVVGQTAFAGRGAGFLRDPGGRVTTITIPGHQVGDVLALNDRGQVVGEAVALKDPDVRHGFVWDRGRITLLDVPRAKVTIALGVNDGGQITGAYADTAGDRHGYVLRNGRYTRIDAPGRTETQAAWGVNDRGQIVVPEPGTGLVL